MDIRRYAVHVVLLYRLSQDVLLSDTCIFTPGRFDLARGRIPVSSFFSSARYTYAGHTLHVLTLDTLGGRWAARPDWESYLSSSPQGGKKMELPFLPSSSMASLLCCGPKLAACGIVLSAWGVIMLVRGLTCENRSGSEGFWG